MKKTWIILAAYLVFGSAGALLWMAVREAPYEDVPSVHFKRLEEGEAGWTAAQITDYAISVEVSFGDEKRLHAVTVQDGVVVDAEFSYWDDSAGDWGRAQPMSAEAAGYFTVPGLYGTLWEALRNEEVPREALRAQIEGNPPLPVLIYMSSILQDGSEIEGTALVMEIVGFEVLE